MKMYPTLSADAFGRLWGALSGFLNHIQPDEFGHSRPFSMKFLHYKQPSWQPANAEKKPKSSEAPKSDEAPKPEPLPDLEPYARCVCLDTLGGGWMEHRKDTDRPGKIATAISVADVIEICQKEGDQPALYPVPKRITEFLDALTEF